MKQTEIALQGSDLHFLEAELVVRFVFRLAQQACEKIDRTRGHAAQTFASILFAE